MNTLARYRTLFIVAALLGLPALLSGCSLKKPALSTPESALRRVRFSGFVNFSDDLNYAGLALALSQSLAYLQGVPPERQYRFGPDLYSVGHVMRSLTHFLEFIQTNPSPKELKKFIGANYRLYRSTGAPETGKVLFTGYYIPTLRGSLLRSDEFRYPIYSRPEDLLTIDLSQFSQRLPNEKLIGRRLGQAVVPYFDRQQIDQQQGELAIAPVAWVNDPIELFFLHIQGSGKILLEDGATLQVHYDTSNGRPYRSIGKLLIEQGKIEKGEMSMQAIRAYLRENPSEAEAVLNYNPSYVFFKIEADGPLGCLEVPLTPGRTLALDRRIFPAAALAFMQTKLPIVTDEGRSMTWTDSSRWVLNQDTGGAIRGPGRADLFWGDGPCAEIAAGHLQHPGDLYFLVLKPKS